MFSWKRITKIVQSFWKRFPSEYIHSLQERKKWKSSRPDLKVNDVVLIVDENAPSMKWLLGLIEKLIPGSDEKIRVVEVKTKHGVFKRAISKIAKLPIH